MSKHYDYTGPTWAQKRDRDRVNHNVQMDRAGGFGDARRVARDKDRARRSLKTCAFFEGTSAAC